MERKKKIIFLVICFFAVIFSMLFYILWTIENARKTEVIFFDIGQGDSALIKFENGQKMLVDCGPDKNVLSKLGSHLDFFDRTIDYLLVTHPDADHYGGCPAVLERYNIKNIIFGDFQKTDDHLWKVWIKYSAEEKADWKFINGHEKMLVGDSELEFFAPDGENIKMGKQDDTSNNHSVVFLLKNSLGKFLFTGDMEAPLENAILKKYCAPVATPCALLDVDYLKVGHHGSESSSGEEFLEAVAARYAIISSGVKNRYGHPAPRVIKRLERANMIIWRTDQKGDIIVK